VAVGTGIVTVWPALTTDTNGAAHWAVPVWCRPHWRRILQRVQVPLLLSEVSNAGEAGRAEGDRDDPDVALNTLELSIERAAANRAILGIHLGFLCLLAFGQVAKWLMWPRSGSNTNGSSGGTEL